MALGGESLFAFQSSALEGEKLTPFPVLKGEA
jgi:hypothetical protein